MMRCAIRTVARLIPVAIVAMLAACASTPAERTALLLDEGSKLGFAVERFGSAPPLVGMLHAARKPSVSDELWVVMEGDGHAWLNMHQPSADPTPMDAVGWRLAKRITAAQVL